MSNIRSVLLEIRPVLTWLFAASIVLVLCIEFWWTNIPAMFNWKDASKGAGLAKDFLLSYIASYIFFFVNDQWEKSTNKNAMQMAVMYRLFKILKEAEQVMSFLNNARRSFDTSTPTHKLKEIQWLKILVALHEQRTGDYGLYLLIPKLSHYGSRIKEPCSDIQDQYKDYSMNLVVVVDAVQATGEKLAMMRDLSRSSAKTTFAGKEIPDYLRELSRRLTMFYADLHHLVDFAKKMTGKDHHMVSLLKVIHEDTGRDW